MNAWLFVYAIGAAQGAVLALAFWRRSAGLPGSRVLALWMALIAVDLAMRTLYLSDPGPGLLKPYRLVMLFPFLYGSLFYLYVRSLTRDQALRGRDLVHAAGFVLALIAYGDLLLLDAEGTAALYRDLVAGWVPARAPWIDAAMMVYCLAYVGAALVALARYRRALLGQRSDADPTVLRWLQVMAVCQVLIWSIAVLQWQVTLPWPGHRLIYSAVAIWVLLIGYLSLAQSAPPMLQASGQGEDAEAEPAPSNAARPEATAADDPRFPDVEARLEALMTGQGLYREPALSIGQLARRSGYPEYLVSAVINRRHGCHFWDYVNRYRVEAARALLADPTETRTALEIAYHVGFTSKSTFNAAFRRLLGQTPSQCRAENR